MRRNKYALGVILLAFLAGFAGAVATVGKSHTLPEGSAAKHCAADLTSTSHNDSKTWRPTS